MALQHHLSLPSGIDLIAAYTRIQSIQHTHFETTVQTQTWASQVARQEDLQVLVHSSYIIPWQDTVSLTSVYEALKTFTDFENSVDV